MEQEKNAAFSLSAEELEFCISALQLEIETVEHAMHDKNATLEERIACTSYIRSLNALQDEFLRENNSFRSIDLLQVYELVTQERDYLNDAMDDDAIPLDLRQEGRDHLRTANNIMRKLKKYFKAFDIDVSSLQQQKADAF